MTEEAQDSRLDQLERRLQEIADRNDIIELVDRLVGLLDRDTRPDRLMDLKGFRASGERAASYEEARRAAEHAALDEAAARDHALLQELLNRFVQSVNDLGDVEQG